MPAPDLIKLFPMPHLLPAQADRHLLLFTTGDKNTQLINAASEAHMQALWLSKLSAGHYIPEPVAYWQVDFVEPDVDCQLAWAEARCAEEQETFCNILTSLVLTQFQRGELLPEGFTLCPSCEGHPEKRWSCETCESDGVQYEGSWENRYWESRERFKQRYPGRGDPSTFKPQEGAETFRGWPLYVLWGDYGAHAQGLKVQLVSSVEEITQVRGRTLLAFFYGMRLEVPEEIRDSYQAAVAELEARREQGATEHDEQRAEKAREDRVFLNSIFRS